MINRIYWKKDLHSLSVLLHYPITGFVITNFTKILFKFFVQILKNHKILWSFIEFLRKIYNELRNVTSGKLKAIEQSHLDARLTTPESTLTVPTKLQRWEIQILRNFTLSFLKRVILFWKPEKISYLATTKIWYPKNFQKNITKKISKKLSQKKSSYLLN